jgi:PAS domain S-box-containing protein
MEILVTSARAMFDRAVFGVAQASPAGDWQFLNDRFCEIVGHSRQGLLACSERDITHTDDRAASDEVIRWPLADEISLSSLENRLSRGDGTSCGPTCVSLSGKGSRLTGRNVSRW